MRESGRDVLTAPIFLSAAFFVFAVAILEKGLNVFGWSIPFTTVWPNQLLTWAVVLSIFEIALTLRQIADQQWRGRSAHEGEPPSDLAKGVH